MSVPNHGIPDGNAKSSITVIDHVTNTPFAAVGDSNLGTPYIQIVDNTGTPIVSFGGGTQYTDGGVPPVHPIGSTIEWSDGANWQTVSTAKPLPVSGSFSLTNPTIAAAVPATANYIAGNKAGNLTGLLIGSQTTANSLAVALASDQAAIPVTGTFWQATQPVSIATVPSHAVTNAGTFAVQATEADGANTTLGAKADAKSTATDTTAVSAMSVLKQISASVQAPPSQAVTNAGTFAVQATLAAETTKVIGTVNQGTSPWVENISQINGVAPLMGAGNTGTGSPRVTIASDQAVIPISDNSGSLTVDAPLATPVFATITPSTTGGWTPKSLVALSNTKTAVKAGAGTMGGYMFYNPNAVVIYIQVWNVAIASITVGTTAPTYVIPLPATSGANVEFTNGINHSTEINVAATTTATGLTAPSTAIDGFMLFK